MTKDVKQQHTHGTFSIDIGPSLHHDWIDVYITHNGSQWSGMTLRSDEEVASLYYAIGQWLEEKGHGLK